MSSNLKCRLWPTVLFALFATWFFADGIMGSGPLSAQVFDGDGLIGGLSDAESELQGSGIREDASLVETVAVFINFILPYVGLAAFVAFVVAGFFFILGFGSDAAIQRARKIMIWSIVGLVVVIFAFPLTQFIIEFSSAT